MPSDILSLRLRADCYRITSKLDFAIQDASKCLEIFPDDLMALRTRAEVFRRIGRFNDSIRDASRSLAIEPNNTFAIKTINLASSGNMAA